jgi:o-succinylbenzoate---CoA ligase
MSDALSIFDAARDAPTAIAFVDGARTVTYAEAASATRTRYAALLSARPPALALAAEADTESLLWLYAAFASGTPVLTLHARATPSEKARAMQRVGAVEPPALAHTAPTPLPPPTTRLAPLLFIPTSGSTGEPRLVELSRRAVLASAEASAHNLRWLEGDRWLLCLPLSHTGGLSIVVRCLAARRTLLLFRAGPEGLLSDVARLRDALRSATLVSLVPTILERLLDAGRLDAPALRAVLVGGAGCSPALAERAHHAGLPLLTSYGLTETASQVVTRRYAERGGPLRVQSGCVSSGHPLPGVELSLRGDRIALRSPSLLTAYVGEGSPLDADGWLVTNDRGALGPDGELFVLGRTDDLIVTAGENVDPMEVERALLSLPGVRAACVVGTASETYGAVVSALIVTDDAALGELTHLSILLQSQLAAHKRPRRVALVEALPLTPSGKVDKRACVRLLETPVS